MNSKEKFNLAILRLLNFRSFKLFGCLFYKFETNIIESEKILDKINDPEIVDEISNNMTACVYYNNKTITLDIFDCFIENHTVSELLFIIIHEILHVLNGHLKREYGLDRELYNYACDHVINKNLIHESKNNPNITVPKSTFYVKELLKNNLSAEEVYEYLLKKQNNSNNSGNKSPIQLNDYTAVYDTKKESYTIPHVLPPKSTEKKNNSELNSEIDSTTNQIKMETKALLDEIHKTKGRGTISNDLFVYINDLIKVEIPWQQILEKALLVKLISSQKNRSFVRP